MALLPQPEAITSTLTAFLVAAEAVVAAVAHKLSNFKPGFLARFLNAMV
jgi:hypothetical protein